MAAQVSGPGALSKRTDTGGQPIRSLPDPEYGEATAYREQQKGAPLADSSTNAPPSPYPSDIARMGQTAPPLPAAPAEKLPGLFDPGDPDAHVTAGAPLGPGPNSIAGLPGEFNPVSLRDSIMQYAAADSTGMLANLANTLAERGWI